MYMNSEKMIPWTTKQVMSKTFIDNLKLFYPKKIGLIHDRMSGKLQRYDYIDCYIKQKAHFISQDM